MKTRTTLMYAHGKINDYSLVPITGIVDIETLEKQRLNFESGTIMIYFTQGKDILSTNRILSYFYQVPSGKAKDISCRSTFLKCWDKDRKVDCCSRKQPLSTMKRNIGDYGKKNDKIQSNIH